MMTTFVSAAAIRDERGATSESPLARQLMRGNRAAIMTADSEVQFELRGYLMGKAITEWTVALLLLIVTSPLLIALAMLVRLTSPGPALYSQVRLGRYGRKYRIYKLRTMIPDAEAQSGAVWASKNDSRITPVGNFLRATHLDELPQLFNVLLGEMSLIGPRPERPEIAARLMRHVPHFNQRLALRPGITGLAQMRLPADDPHDAEYEGVRMKLDHDLYYIREVSFALDARIALCTPCYFAAAALKAVSKGLLQSHGAAVLGSDQVSIAESRQELAA